MAFVIDRSLYLSPEVVGEPGLRPLKEVDPFSLEALVAWLETKPGDEIYCWGEAGECLFGQYAKFALPDIKCSHTRYLTLCKGFGHRSVTFPDLIIEPPDVAQAYPRTFGAALSRAKALLAEREK